MSDFYEGRMIPLKIADAAIISCNKEIEKLQIENARLKAEVERLRKAGEWQPIETAPAFPTKILFGGFFKPGWGDGFWWQHGYKAGALEIEATHWMPEPQPPAKEGTQS